jgi:DNA-binding winged helix-turn-helix (wHTH) protein
MLEIPSSNTAPPTRPPRLRFGPFEADLAKGELRRDGSRVRLSAQPFRALALLASRPGQVVSREELRREIWGEDTFVDFEGGLNFCIKQVRRALGDDANAPRFVRTIPRRGYSFIARVEGLPAASSPWPAFLRRPQRDLSVWLRVLIGWLRRR